MKNKRLSRRKAKNKISNKVSRIIENEEEVIYRGERVTYKKSKKKITEFSNYGKDALTDVDKNKASKLVERKAKKQVKKNEKYLSLMTSLLVEFIIKIIEKWITKI